MWPGYRRPAMPPSGRRLRLPAVWISGRERLRRRNFTEPRVVSRCMSRFGHGFALAAVALTVIAAPAAAAPPWSAPVTITNGIPELAQPAITVAGNGRAIVSARLTTRAQGFPTKGFSRLFGQQPDGSFAGRARIVLAAPPVAYATSRLALLRMPLA